MESDITIVPDLAIHEVANALYVQERILHKIPNGSPYISLMFGAIESHLLRVLESSEELVGRAYEIARRNDGAVYDCLFVAVALSTGQGLKTRDERQRSIYDREIARGFKGANPKGKERVNGT